MANLVSPGLRVRERDLTTSIPAVSTSIGGIAGAFRWGPVDRVTTISSEQQLVDIFGEPDNQTAQYFFSAVQFLHYGNTLKVVRPESGHRNASASNTGVLIKNRDHYDEQKSNLDSGSDYFVAKYPGTLGNSLTVEICSASTSNSQFTDWAYQAEFDSAPGTSDYARRIIGGTAAINDEIHVAVVDTGGHISGTPGTVLETFPFVSQAPDGKKEDGSSNYYADVINNQSRYVWWGDHHTNLTDAGATITSIAARTGNTSYAVSSNITSLPLSDGIDDNQLTVGELYNGYALFSDRETEEVSLLIGGAYGDSTSASSTSHANALIGLVESRGDCMVTLSPPLNTNVNNSDPATAVVDWFNGIQSSSYAIFDSGALYIYDKYNDIYRYITAAGAIAGLCANTDRVADPWYSPAGYDRGRILGITKIAWNPNQAARDSLYKARINPLVSFPGRGTILFGDKTGLAKPSAFDRINVRRLFIVLKKAISNAARSNLFEFNDEFTRAQFRNLVIPYLRDVQSRRGITNFEVVCDRTNNTPQVVDTNRFVGDIYIAPARSINFIELNFVATRTGVAFSEIVGRV